MKKNQSTAIKIFSKILLSIIIVSFFIALVQKEYHAARLRTVNYFIPSSYEYLRAIEKGSAAVDRIKVDQYKFYYQKITRYKPALAEAHALLGFCYYYLGDIRAAKDSFKKAFGLNKDFFWFSYNLGVLLFKEGDYRAVTNLMRKNVTADSNIIIEYISRSKIYRDILAGITQPEKELAQRSRSGYCDSYRLLVLSYYRLGDYQKALSCASEGLFRFQERAGFFYYYAGLAAYQLHQYNQAIFFFKKSLASDPSSAEPYSYLGLCLKATGQEDAAIEILKKAEIVKKSAAVRTFEGEDINLRLF